MVLCRLEHRRSEKGVEGNDGGGNKGAPRMGSGMASESTASSSYVLVGNRKPKSWVPTNDSHHNPSESVKFASGRSRPATVKVVNNSPYNPRPERTASVRGQLDPVQSPSIEKTLQPLRPACAANWPLSDMDCGSSYVTIWPDWLDLNQG